MARPSEGQRQPGAPCRSAITTADPGRIIQENMRVDGFSLLNGAHSSLLIFTQTHSVQQKPGL